MFEKIFPSEVYTHFTDSSVDFILPEHAHSLSAAQREYLLSKLKIEPEKVFTLRQVHGHKVLNVRKNDLPQKSPLPEADAVFTNVPGIVLSVRTADCLPVFLYDPGKRVIAMVHAGWRSTAEKISAAAVTAMADQFGTRASDLQVAFGPAIRPCCYEVGEEFKKTFPEEITEHKGKYFLDVALANKRQLVAAGVRETNIFDTEACTMCNAKFYSFRRDKEKAGRHLSLIMLK